MSFQILLKSNPHKRKMSPASFSNMCHSRDFPQREGDTTIKISLLSQREYEIRNKRVQTFNQAES